ncbi:MAG TPA: metallophosphoesterase family protein [Spirochaetia bacterium]|nr:metallophosphoesterase family protein [Spirochaetia bacterium]
MTCAIISDIHSNLEALEAVLTAIAGFGVDAVYCLGDIVGYGPNPNECTKAALDRCDAVVRGNHDKAVAGLMPMDWFNTVAREGALWNRRNASAETLAAIRGLPAGPLDVGEGILLCHGTPMDEDRYLVDAQAIEESYAVLDREHPGVRFCFNGHSHYPVVVARRASPARPSILRGADRVKIEAGATYLINPGSVGQPRDGNPHASFGILETSRRVYRNLRVAYGVQETQRKIIAAGLPDELAWRLAEGR